MKTRGWKRPLPRMTTPMGQSCWLPPMDWRQLPGFSSHWSILNYLPSDFGLPLTTLLSVEVSSNSHHHHWDYYSPVAERYLQAVKALLHVSTLDPGDSELHVRLVDIRKFCKSWWRQPTFSRHSCITGPTLPQLPPAPIGPTASELLEELIPLSTNLETYNAEYLQRGGPSASVVLAAAKASRILGATEDEISGTVFNLLNPGVDLSIKVGYYSTARVLLTPP